MQASTPCTSASTPCTSRSTKGCADCRALCEYDRMQEVAGCLQDAAGCMQDAAGCMQTACSLHAACIRSYAGGCRLQQAACRMQQAACRLHAACMQPACISSVALALNAFTDPTGIISIISPSNLLHSSLTLEPPHIQLLPPLEKLETVPLVSSSSPTTWKNFSRSTFQGSYGSWKVMEIFRSWKSHGKVMEFKWSWKSHGILKNQYFTDFL